MGTQPPLLDLPHQQSRLSLRPSRCSAQVPQERSTPSQGLRFLDNYLPSDLRSRPPSVLSSIRCYSAPSGLSKDEVQGRIMDLLKNFDKVTDASKISGTSHFQNDLGLDSLDTVEVVMAIE